MLEEQDFLYFGLISPESKALQPWKSAEEVGHNEIKSACSVVWQGGSPGKKNFTFCVVKDTLPKNIIILPIKLI